jgi:hypothetical protein
MTTYDIAFEGAITDPDVSDAIGADARCVAGFMGNGHSTWIISPSITTHGFTTDHPFTYHGEARYEHQV